jgi:hypothetical protein
MTPERLKELRSRVHSPMTTECLDEIERLQSELQHFHKLTRKLVRQKLDLESELTACNDKLDHKINNSELLWEDSSRKLAKVVGQLEIELAAIKTAHTCRECMWLNESYDDDVCFCPAQSSVVYIYRKDKPWLCGHWQKKGTK